MILNNILLFYEAYRDTHPSPATIINRIKQKEAGALLVSLVSSGVLGRVESS